MFVIRVILKSFRVCFLRVLSGSDENVNSTPVSGGGFTARARVLTRALQRLEEARQETATHVQVHHQVGEPLFSRVRNSRETPVRFLVLYSSKVGGLAGESEPPRKSCCGGTCAMPSTAAKKGGNWTLASLPTTFQGPQGFSCKMDLKVHAELCCPGAEKQTSPSPSLCIVRKRWKGFQSWRSADTSHRGARSFPTRVKCLF